VTTTDAGPALRGPRFDTARAVADAVLFEGYVLYPYRASAAKNRMRWQFGVLVPPGWGTDRAEHAHLRTECLMEPRSGAALRVELRFLHAQRRVVQRALGDGEFETVDRLELPDRVLVAWDEGVDERVELDTGIAELLEQEVVLPFSRPARREVEPVRDAAGRTVGRLVRTRERLDGELRLTARELPGPFRVMRLTAVASNTGAWAGPGPSGAAGTTGASATTRTNDPTGASATTRSADPTGTTGTADPTDPSAATGAAGADRAAALARSLVSAHLMLGLTAGSFVSMTDPPEWARAAVDECRNEHVWPVLAGADGGADVLLASPIILADHPHIAPESPGALYDATEIDEILTLRTAALTDEEKREARGTDDRAAAVIDLADSMPPQVLERLHGAVRALREVTDGGGGGGDGPLGADDPSAVPGYRGDTPWWDPAADRSVDPARDRVPVDGVPVGAGDRVLLRPGKRRTDAQDIFLSGRTATVEAVLHDVDGGVHLAVTVDGDPGTELRRAQGRFWYFQPDEVAPVARS
jgi:hypothetical protein